MAKQTETPRKKRKAGEIAMWILMAFLILGLGGFGLENFGGGSATVARVGDRTISANDYARQLQSQLNAVSQQFGQSVTIEQARAFGIDRQVIGGLVELAAQDAEADRTGVSVGDAVVASAITRNSAFAGPAGQFDRSTYTFALQSSNLTEARFESQLREDISRSLLVGSIRGGFVAPQVLTETLFTWMGERRAVSVLQLTAADLPEALPAPTDDELRAWYDANIASFTRPEAKRIAYAALQPAEVEAGVTVDEAAVRALYDSRIAEFVQPEKRLVERLVFPDMAEAEAAKARIDAGASFDEVVVERGLALEDTDMGDVARSDLGAAAEAIFALDEPGVVGPLMSSLGPALFRMNAVLAPQETPFDEARTGLEAEVRADAARREIVTRTEAVDDSLAGGATIEDLAAEQGMRSAVTDYARGADDNDPITQSPAFRAALDAAQEGDFAEALTLEDGSLVAFEVQGIIPPAPVPFETARDRVAAAWQTDQLARALDARALEAKAAVEAGGQLGAWGIVDVVAQLPREGSVAGAPEELMTAVFEMAEGGLRVIDGPGGYVALVRVDRVIPAPADTPDALMLRQAIDAQIEQGISDDAVALWTQALTAERGISIDQQAIDAIHAQFN